MTQKTRWITLGMLAAALGAGVEAQTNIFSLPASSIRPATQPSPELAMQYQPGPALAQATPAPNSPAAQPDNTSVYAAAPVPNADEGVNAGGAHFTLNVNYMSEYIFRGVNYSKVAGASDDPNEQINFELEFNTGKLPHPFLGVFSNIQDSDPVSHFQEFRPYEGFKLDLHPLNITVGNTNYIYPEREQFNTAEVFARLTLDDSTFFHSKTPVFTPYVYGAYDYSLNYGFYLEAGVRHDFTFKNSPLKLSVVGDVGYINGIEREFIYTNVRNRGFQHYDVGLIGSYPLNGLLNIPDRFGTISLQGYIYYTGGIQRQYFNTVDQLWGGGGIAFQY